MKTVRGGAGDMHLGSQRFYSGCGELFIGPTVRPRHNLGSLRPLFFSKGARRKGLIAYPVELGIGDGFCRAQRPDHAICMAINELTSDELVAVAKVVRNKVRHDCFSLLS